MNPEKPRDPQTNPHRPIPSGDPGGFTQEIQHSQVSARVPEKIGRGVFSTGIMIFQGANEFVIDFVQSLAAPHQVVARVVLPFSIMPNVIAALRENLANYQTKFGPPPALRRIRQALLDLRPEEKEVFLLRQNGELSYEQIAQMRKCPIGTVKTQMRTALEKLHEVLT